MAFSVILTNATPTNTVEDVRYAFEKLDIGKIDTIDSYAEEHNLRIIRTFTIHFSDISNNLFARQFYERLLLNDIQEKAGDRNIIIPRVIYGTWRDGTDMMWYVHLANTPETGQREHKNVRIEM